MRVRRHIGSAARPRDGAEPPAPEEPVAREAKGRRRPTVAGQRLVRDAIVLASIFAVGYVAASAWLSPVPLLTSEHAVPRVLELSVDEAQRKLAALDFRVKLDESRPHPSIPRGQVVWQDPPPGVVLGPNATVLLAPSAGPLGVPIPDVVGLAVPQATQILLAAGLKVGEIDSIAADPEPGIVIATRPAVGTARDPGTEVGLVVSGRPLVGLVEPPRAPRAQAAKVRLVARGRR